MWEAPGPSPPWDSLGSGFESVSGRDSVYRRAGHVSWTLGHLFFTWGGVVEHIYNRPKGPNRAPTNGNSFHDPSIVQAYDPSTSSWTRLVTSGKVPRPTAGAAATLLGDVVFVFGGFCHWDEQEGGEQEMSDRIYRLDLETRIWTLLHPCGIPPPPSDKGLAWNHGGNVHIFGGYGDMREDSDGIDSSYSQDLNPFSHRSWPRGWNNALVRYNVNKDTWEWPDTRGTPPSPRAAAAGAMAGECFYVFGGRTIHRRTNDLHQLNPRTMRWTTICRGTLHLDPFGPLEPGRPESRSLHSLTATTATTLVLYGGLSQLAAPLNDCWLLHLEEGRADWEEVELPYDHGEVRCWHAAGLSEDGELIVHSGLTQEFYLTRIDLDDHPESVLHLRFGVMSLRRLCLEAVVDMADNIVEVDKSDNTVEENMADNIVEVDMTDNTVEVDMADNIVEENSSKLMNNIEALPHNLRAAVLERIHENDLEHYKPPPKYQQYQRETLKAGI